MVWGVPIIPLVFWDKKISIRGLRGRRVSRIFSRKVAEPPTPLTISLTVKRPFFYAFPILPL